MNWEALPDSGECILVAVADILLGAGKAFN